MVLSHGKEIGPASVEKTGRLLVVHGAVRNFGDREESAANVQGMLSGKLVSPAGRPGVRYCWVPIAKKLQNATLVQLLEMVADAKHPVSMG